MSIVMKPSGVQWIGNIPEHWKTERIKDVSEKITGGGTPKSSIEEYWENGDVIWVTPTDYQDFQETKYINNSRRKITKKGLESCSAELLPINTVVMSSRASIGIPKITKVPLTTNQGFISFIESSKLNSDFLYYCIDCYLGRYYLIIANGTTFKEISPTVAKQEKIPFPTLKEQKSIANFLDKATSQIDNAIKTKQTQLETLEMLKKSIIHKAITKGLDASVVMKDSGIEWIGETPEHWNIEKIKQKYDVISSNVDKKSYDDEISVSLCNYTDVYYKDYITNDIEFMAATATDLECKKFQLNIDDVIITKDSEDPHDIAVPALVKEIANNLLCGYHLSMIRSINSNSSGSYLFWCLKDSSIASQLHREATGITRWAIAKKHIKNSLIPMPPIEEQKNICIFLEAEIEKINTLKSNVKNQINKLKEYKKSLIYEYVTGKKQVKE